MSTKTIYLNEIKNENIRIERDSDTTIVALCTKGWEDLRKLNFYFEDESAKLTFIALIIGTEENQFRLETTSNHKVPNTNAYYYIRSAMFDRSKIDFKGNLIIEKGAHQTDSYLAHHTLMLSKNAKTETEPCLEIEADDVSAGHAATVGQVDETLLFYLQSRGLNKKEAQDVLIKGFLEADFDKIPDEDLKEKLTQEIDKYLNVQSSGN